MAESSSRDPSPPATADVTESPGIVREELARTLSSTAFAQSESLKRFLSHIVEAKLDGREDELKESLLGLEVFGRGDTYDPRIDPIVRVQATRLRAKLREFRADEGTDAPISIELPKGSYVPQFKRRTAESVSPDEPLASGVKTTPWGKIAAAVAVAGAVASFGWLQSRTDSAGGAAEVRSLAILPFTDMSPRGDHGYYGDGLAEEITTTLARVDRLAVTPRTSAFAFRDEPLDVIRDGLGVDAIVQGSVRQAGDQLRIAAQLIRVADGRQLWSSTYDEAGQDAFDVQDGIARSVARAIAVELADSGVDEPVPAAYEAVLKAKFELERMSPQSVRLAIGSFEEAIDLDPSYMPAYSGLVHALVADVLWGFSAPSGTRALAREASDRALALGGDHPEALSAAAVYELIYEWDFEAVRALLDRAEGSYSGDDDVQMIRGLLRMAEGELAESASALEQAADVQPRIPFRDYLVAHVAFFAGRDGDTLEALRVMRQGAPGYALAFVLESEIRLRQGAFDEASAALDAFDRVSGETLVGLAARGVVHARSGRESEARAALAALRKRSESGYVPPVLLVRVLLSLGEEDAAFDEFARSAREHTLPILVLAADPDLEALRADRRFHALMEEVGL